MDLDVERVWTWCKIKDKDINDNNSNKVGDYTVTDDIKGLGTIRGNV